MRRLVGENRLPSGRNHGEKHDRFGIERRKMGQVFGHASIDEDGLRKSQEYPELQPPGRGRPGSKQPLDSRR